MRTLVVQSHRSPLPVPWLQACIDSVANWSQLHGYDYRWLGDELFDGVPTALREKTRGHLPMTADLARLQVLQEAIAAGYQRAVWVDADVLVLAPKKLSLGDGDHGFGREVWVQARNDRGSEPGSLRVYQKIHNAFMHFTATSTVLPFYADTASRLLIRHQGEQLAPQLIGPKLLTALHNLAAFNVLETAAMLPPLVARDLARYEANSTIGPALALFNQHSNTQPAALNLCSSLNLEIQSLEINMSRLIDQLLAEGMLWPGISQD